MKGVKKNPFSISRNQTGSEGKKLKKHKNIEEILQKNIVEILHNSVHVYTPLENRSKKNIVRKFNIVIWSIFFGRKKK